VGLGILKVTDGVVIGVDLAGSRYRGQMLPLEGSDEVEFRLEMAIPPGVSLVQGTSAQPIPYVKALPARLPVDFANGAPIAIRVSPGTVTIMIKRIPDEYGPYASGININISPQAQSGGIGV
jgi:hypothetical protein